MVERTLISFPSQLQLIERLQHLLYLSSSITFISGEAGSGKSSLVEQLSNLLPDDTQQAFISLSQPTSATQIRQQIISQLFEQPLFNAEDSLCNILLLLKDSQVSDVSRAVVIDNAGLLPEQLLIELAEVIDQKLNFTDNEFSFILLSDNSKTSQMVRSIKKLPNHLKVATLTFKLAPLTSHEAQLLLNHRFEQIGYAPQLEHQDAINLQLSRCQGIPEKILALASQVSSGELDNNRPSWLKAGLPAVLIMILLLFVVASLAYYLYPKFINSDTSSEAMIEIDEPLPDDIPILEITAPTLSDAESTESLAGEWKNSAQSVDDNELRVGKADSQERVIISDQLLAEISSPEALETISETNNIEQAVLPQSDQYDVVETVPEKLQELTEPEVPAEAILDIQDENEDTERVALDDSTPQIVAPVIKQQEVDALDNVIPIKDVIKSQLGGVFTAQDVLLAINPNAYTLQLAGFGSEQSLKRFIGQHKLPRADVYLYQTIRNKKPWYVVIYGQFESRETATAQAQNLPDTLVSLKSWVKKYALVHQDLQRDE